MQWPPGHPGMQAPRRGGFPGTAPPLQGAPTGVTSVQGGRTGSNAIQGGARSPAGQEGEAGKNENKAEKDTEPEEVRKAWSAHKNDEGVAYYYNSVTGESTYEKPKGFVGEVSRQYQDRGLGTAGDSCFVHDKVCSSFLIGQILSRS